MTSHQDRDRRAAIARALGRVEHCLEVGAQAGLAHALAEAHKLIAEERSESSSAKAPPPAAALPMPLVIHVLLAADRDASGEARKCVRVAGMAPIDVQLQDARAVLRLMELQVQRKTRSKADLLSVAQQLAVRHYARCTTAVDAATQHAQSLVDRLNTITRRAPSKDDADAQKLYVRDHVRSRTRDVDVFAEDLTCAILQCRAIDTASLREWLAFDAREREDRARAKNARVVEPSLVMHAGLQDCAFGFVDGAPAWHDADPRTAERVGNARLCVFDNLYARFALMAHYRAHLDPDDLLAWFNLVLAGVPPWECTPVHASNHSRAGMFVELLAASARASGAANAAAFESAIVGSVALAFSRAVSMSAVSLGVAESLRDCELMLGGCASRPQRAGFAYPGAVAQLCQRVLEETVSGGWEKGSTAASMVNALFDGVHDPRSRIEALLRPPLVATGRWLHVLVLLLLWRRTRHLLRGLSRQGQDCLDVGPPLDPSSVAWRHAREPGWSETDVYARRAVRLRLVAAATELDELEPQMTRGLHPSDARVLADLLDAHGARMTAAAFPGRRVPAIGRLLAQYVGFTCDDVERIREHADTVRSTVGSSVSRASVPSDPSVVGAADSVEAAAEASTAGPRE